MTMLRQIKLVFTEEDDNGSITVERHLVAKNDTGSSWHTLVASAFQTAEKMASELEE